MNQRQIGLIIIIAAVLFFIVTLTFTLKVQALNKVLHVSCTLPDEVCPFTAFPSQGILGFVFVALLAAFGLFLIFPKKAVKEIKKPKIALKGLREEEKKVLKLVAEEGTMFQAELVEKSGLGKVKVTRVLDILEGKGLIERKRRGMSNVVILKHN